MDNHLVITEDTAKETVNTVHVFATLPATETYPTINETNTKTNASACAYCIAASASYSS